MEVQGLRSEIHDFINHADEKFLKMVYKIIKAHKNSIVVGYNADGSSITQEELKVRAKAASMRVKSGDYLTQEEVEKEIENW